MFSKLSLLSFFILIMTLLTAPRWHVEARSGQTAELPPLAFSAQNDWYTNNNLPASQFDGRSVSGHFNDDGMSDIALISGAGTINVMTSTGTSFNPPADWYDFGSEDPPPGFYAGTTVAGDFNNDGFDDVAAFLPYLPTGGTPAVATVYLSDGSSGFKRQRWALIEPYYLEAKQRIVSGDFDGDGWHDDVALLFYNGADTNLFVLLSDGSKFEQPVSWGKFENFDSDQVTGRVTAGDFNADGIDDLGLIYEVPYDGTYRARAYVFFSSGAAFSRSTWWNVSGYNAQEALGRVVAGDWDGDGDDDLSLIYRYPGNLTRAHVLLATRYLEFIYQGNSGWWSNSSFNAVLVSGRTVTGDWDGNGIDDIGMLYGTDYLQTWVLISTAVSPSSEETLYVDPDFAGCPTGSPFPERFCSLQEALNAARDGQRIELAQGIYSEWITIPRYPNAGFNQEVTFAGAGVDATVLDGQNQGTVVTIGHYGRVFLSGVTIQNGTAVEGGGIFTEGYLNFTNGRLTGNRAQEHGGALNSESNATTFVVDSLVDNNTAQWGGAISSLDSLTQIENTILRGNIASEQGGALLIDGGDAVVRSSSFDDNLSQDGGAIQLRTSVLNMAGSTLGHNQATRSGGALLVEDDGNAFLLQNTIYGNGAADGALVIALAGRAYIQANTIAGNETSGISFWDTPNTRIGRTLLAENVGGNCDISIGSNLVTNLGYNMATDTSCGFFAGTDQVVDDAFLGPLQNNGGPAETMALLEGSPAIDAIPFTNCEETPADQRGVIRPQDGNDDGQALCDIGSFELMLRDGSLYLPVILR